MYDYDAGIIKSQRRIGNVDLARENIVFITHHEYRRLAALRAINT